MAVDITVTHPLAPHRYPLSLDKVSACLAEAELAKAKAAEDRCSQAGWSYMGAAFTPWGSPGPQAKQLLFELTKKATSGLSGRDRDRRSTTITQSISLAFARELARQLELRYKVQVDQPVVRAMDVDQGC